MPYVLTHKQPDSFYKEQSLIAEKEAMCRKTILKDIIKKRLGREVLVKEDYDRFKIVLDDRFPRFEFIEFDGNKIGHLRSTVKQEGDQWFIKIEFNPFS